MAGSTSELIHPLQDSGTEAPVKWFPVSETVKTGGLHLFNTSQTAMLAVASDTDAAAASVHPAVLPVATNTNRLQPLRGTHTVDLPLLKWCPLPGVRSITRCGSTVHRTV